MTTSVCQGSKLRMLVPPARNFRASARLHLQHFLHLNTVEGHLLDHRIESSIAAAQNLKIADLGCANGIWLIDLHTKLFDRGISVQLDGYDITPVHFPAPAYLPQSITLKKLDVFSRPLPEEMIGVYDIVHVRGFVSMIANSNVTPLLSTALALLKPGGWLQWVDVRIDWFSAESPSLEISKAACETLLQAMVADADARGLEGDWLDVLDRHLKEHSFKNVHLRTYETRKQDLKAWTEDYLMLMEDLHVLFPSQEKDPQASMTKESWNGLFAKAVKETEQGDRKSVV